MPTNEEGPKGKWITHTKGQAGAAAFEICVLREDNTHGIRSYGWFDKNKLLVSHGSGLGVWSLTEQVWNKCVQVAHEVAKELNENEQAVR